jgi:hypothetical protein
VEPQPLALILAGKPILSQSPAPCNQLVAQAPLSSTQTILPTPPSSAQLASSSSLSFAQVSLSLPSSSFSAQAIPQSLSTQTVASIPSFPAQAVSLPPLSPAQVTSPVSLSSAQAFQPVPPSFIQAFQPDPSSSTQVVPLLPPSSAQSQAVLLALLSSESTQAIALGPSSSIQVATQAFPSIPTSLPLSQTTKVQQCKSVTLPNGDICTKGSWIIAAEEGNYNQYIIGQVEEIMQYIGSPNHQGFRPDSILIQTAINHGLEPKYKMPHITLSGSYRLINPLVRSYVDALNKLILIHLLKNAQCTVNIQHRCYMHNCQILESNKEFARQERQLTSQKKIKVFHDCDNLNDYILNTGQLRNGSYLGPYRRICSFHSNVEIDHIIHTGCITEISWNTQKREKAKNKGQNVATLGLQGKRQRTQRNPREIVLLSSLRT